MLARLPVLQNFGNGDIISVMNRKYTIDHQPEQYGGAFLKGRHLIVTGQEEFLHRRVTDFLKKIAHQELLELSRQKAARIGCQIHNVCIKDTKSRWGSCSSKNNINYNWRIVMAPDYVIDYLVSHEVAHLAHQNHSPAFWECVAFLCPGYEEGRHWLKIRGKELYHYA